jgi:hypothetical protein
LKCNGGNDRKEGSQVVTTVDLVTNFVKATSRLRLLAHCRNLNISIDGWADEAGEASHPLHKLVSSIQLWNSLGRITLKVHFDIETAIAWAASGLNKSKDQVESAIALDFMREYSNLHAGFLRGLFESKGIEFAMTLPFVNEDYHPRSRPATANYNTSSWMLTDGQHEIRYSVELEFDDALNVDLVREVLLSDEKEESDAEPNNEGLVEFLIS